MSQHIYMFIHKCTHPLCIYTYKMYGITLFYHITNNLACIADFSSVRIQLYPINSKVVLRKFTIPLLINMMNTSLCDFIPRLLKDLCFVYLLVYFNLFQRASPSPHIRTNTLYVASLTPGIQSISAAPGWVVM